MMKLNIQLFGSTNKTTNYNLSQYIGTDKPTYLGDYNSDMLKIDTNIKSISDANIATDTKASLAKTTADTALENANSASSKAETATSTANSAIVQINNLLNILRPIGSFLETINAEFNPNDVYTGQTWNRVDDGTALVSYKETGKFSGTINTIVGEEEHTLTINEMPEHNHSLKGSLTGEEKEASNIGNDWAQIATDWTNDSYIANAGGSQAHNNVQPSKIVYRWLRTA